MPLQDLTPELRTRLSRVERMVGWFVTIATLILLAGFAYYIYATAQNRGWFVTKLNFATTINDATGFKLGDPVKLMGFNVGEVTGIVPNDPNAKRGVTIFFRIRDPYYGYVWWDSEVQVISDFLGNRYLEVEKGKTGAPSVFKDTNGELLVMNRYLAYHWLTNALTNFLVSLPTNTIAPDPKDLVKITNELTATIKANKDTYYTNAAAAGYTHAIDFTRPIGRRNYYFMPVLDSPSLQDRLNAVADEVEKAIPSFLAITNQLGGVLSNANVAAVHVNSILANIDPILTNVTVITGNLRDPNGSLGRWVLPPDLLQQIHNTLHSATETLDAAHTTLEQTDTNVTRLATDLDKSLEHLADLTGDLAAQVHSNSNLVSEISTTIIHTDDLIQGLKREWFLRGAFKTKKPKATNEPPSEPAHHR